jgi:hypothetical protein
LYFVRGTGIRKTPIFAKAYNATLWLYRSSLEANQVHATMPPHTTWGQTATDEYEVAQYLSTFQLESEKVVEVDSWLITSIFQQQKRKKDSRIHHIQHLHPDRTFKLDSATAKAIQKLFEERKAMLVRCKLSDAIRFGKEMRKEIKDAYPDLVDIRAHETTILW